MIEVRLTPEVVVSAIFALEKDTPESYSRRNARQSREVVGGCFLCVSAVDGFGRAL